MEDKSEHKINTNKVFYVNALSLGVNVLQNHNAYNLHIKHLWKPIFKELQHRLKKDTTEDANPHTQFISHFTYYVCKSQIPNI